MTQFPAVIRLYLTFWKYASEWEEYYSKDKFHLSDSEAEDRATDAVWNGITDGTYPELKPLLAFPEWVDQDVFRVREASEI